MLPRLIKYRLLQSRKKIQTKKNKLTNHSSLLINLRNLANKRIKTLPYTPFNNIFLIRDLLKDCFKAEKAKEEIY